MLLLETQPLQLHIAPIKSFIQSLPLFYSLKSNITDSSCSFLTFCNIPTGILSCFVHPLYLNSWHSLSLHIHLQPTICIVPYYNVSIIEIHWFSVKFWHSKPSLVILNVVNVKKFITTGNPCNMAKLLSGYKRKDRDNEAGSSRDNEDCSDWEIVCRKHKCRKYNTKYLSFGFTNIDVNGEERPTVFVWTFWLQTAWGQIN